MRAAVFFLLLCIMQVGANPYFCKGAQALTHTHHHAHKPQKTRYTNPDYSAIADNQSDTDIENCINDDDNEDEPVHSFFSENFRLLAMCYASIPHQSILTYYHNFYDDPPSFPGQLAYKYILQGVWRI